MDWDFKWARKRKKFKREHNTNDQGEHQKNKRRGVMSQKENRGIEGRDRDNRLKGRDRKKKIWEG